MCYDLSDWWPHPFGISDAYIYIYCCFPFTHYEVTELARLSCMCVCVLFLGMICVVCTYYSDSSDM